MSLSCTDSILPKRQTMSNPIGTVSFESLKDVDVPFVNRVVAMGYLV